MTYSSAQLYHSDFTDGWEERLKKGDSRLTVRGKDSKNSYGSLTYEDDDGVSYYFEYVLWIEKKCFVITGSSEKRNKSARHLAANILGLEEKTSYLLKNDKRETRRIVEKIIKKHESNVLINPKFKFKEAVKFKNKEYHKLSYELGGKKFCALDDDKRDFEKLYKSCNPYDFTVKMQIGKCAPLVKEYEEFDGKPYTYSFNLSKYYAVGISKTVSPLEWYEFFTKFY